MNPNKLNIKKWIKALRSGDFKQCQSALKKVFNEKKQGIRHCCLGVACEVALKNGIKLKAKEIEGDFYFNKTAFYLPTVVSQWLGIGFNPALIDEKGKKILATDLNDNMRYDFKQIADALERTYLKKLI